MSPQERVELARTQHREVWCPEPITKCPVNETQTRLEASRSASNDQQQNLIEVRRSPHCLMRTLHDPRF